MKYVRARLSATTERLERSTSDPAGGKNWFVLGPTLPVTVGTYVSLRCHQIPVVEIFFFMAEGVVAVAIAWALFLF